MLTHLSIRNIVLIEAIDIEFAQGLTVLTGETGAGKSIILDALSLALGGRGDRGLIRQGAEQASVSATIELSASHPARRLASEADLALDAGEPLILRRTISSSGATRAFLNDIAIGVQLMKAIGDLVVEFHGQGDEQVLLDPRGHLALLDAFAGLEENAAQVRSSFQRWHEAQSAEAEFEARRRAAEAEREYLMHASQELAALAPQPGEEAALAAERALRLGASRLAEDVSEAHSLLTGAGGLETRLGQALRRLERAPEEAHAIIGPATSALERAVIEAGEARASLEAALDALRHDPQRLAAVEERLFALRAAARKFRVSPDELAAKRADIEESLAAIGSAEQRAGALAQATQREQSAFLAAARALSQLRRAASAKLDERVGRELAPLRLGKAVFETLIEELPPERAGGAGLDKVEFRVRTNSGTAPGPLKDIASGGELARFVLALKVVLAHAGEAGTLVFDEVDRGIGGAVADAVGERLSRLAASTQVLVVTHSPQVAARGHHHILVEKQDRRGASNASLIRLEAAERREEIARMLSGAQVTQEARAAATRLLGAAIEDQAEASPRKRKRASL